MPTINLRLVLINLRFPEDSVSFRSFAEFFGVHDFFGYKLDIKWMLLDFAGYNWIQKLKAHDFLDISGYIWIWVHDFLDTKWMLLDFAGYNWIQKLKAHEKNHESP